MKWINIIIQTQHLLWLLLLKVIWTTFYSSLVYNVALNDIKDVDMYVFDKILSDKWAIVW